MKAKNWEVGSTWFTITPPSKHNVGLDGFHIMGEEKISYLSTCRSAIDSVLSEIDRQGVAIVPGFTCHSVIDPFKKHGYEVYGYPINEDFTISWSALRSMIESLQPSVILFHGYFGFDNIRISDEFLKCLRIMDIVVIEDMTQNMFSTSGHILSDYKVGSIRKWFPVPDGAFVSGLSKLEIPSVEDRELEDAKLKAMEYKGRYIIDGVGDKDSFMHLFGEAELLLDSRNTPYAISQYTRDYISSQNIYAFNERRRNNYNTLVSRLSIHKELGVVHPVLTESEVPFMLPIFMDEWRGDFQQYMAQHNIYPTIIWKCPDELRNRIDHISKRVYDKILCFHIDQRYDEEDMEKVANAVDAYFEK